MRKDEGDITEADKKDAKRRIQGAVTEESPEDSGADDLAASGLLPASAHASHT
jgi:hypothetical protein